MILTDVNPFCKKLNCYQSAKIPQQTSLVNFPYLLVNRSYSHWLHKIHVMRNMLLLLVCFTLSPVFGQTWISSNATWHYNFEELSGTSVQGFYKYYYDHDTLLAGKNCQVIEGKIYEFYTWPTVQFLDSTELLPRYTYVSNDTVFYWNNDQFFVLYDFSAEIGDTWIISTTGSGSCEDTSRVEVVDKSTITLNGQLYRTITLEPVDSSSYGLTGTFCEKFGLMSSDLPWHLFPRIMFCDGTIVEWYYNSFKCYEDDDFSLYNPSGTDCEYLLTHLAIEEDQSQNFLTLYPNPATEMLRVDSPENGTLEIMTLSGKKVLSTEITVSENVNLAHLESGTYVAHLTTNSGAVSHQLFVKQ